MNWSSGVCRARNLLGLGVEVVELALDDRDHVPGDVLVDLGVLERAELALAVLVLAGSTSSLCSAAIRSAAVASGGGGLHARPYYTNPDWD